MSAGNLACQRDSYLRELHTTVATCTPAADGLFHVTFEDTVLFPEGGGQPHDTGSVNGTVAVVAVVRKGAVAVHHTQSPLEPGTPAHQTVDWKRRWDHMQQHSAQHLITAVASDQFGLKTTSWSLGATKSTIDLVGERPLTDEVMQQLEDKVNEIIAEGRDVVATTYQPNSPELMAVRSRGLPEDVLASGAAIRVVSIGGLDVNTCCGTHVKSTAHLQTVKLLHTEASRGGSRLHFVAGERTRALLGAMYSDMRTLGKSFTCGLELVVDRAEGAIKTSKMLGRQVKALLKEAAESAAKQLAEEAQQRTEAASGSAVVVVHHHRDEADQDYLLTVASPLATLPIVAFLSITPPQEGSTPSYEGQFLLVGANEQHVAAAASAVSVIVDGKGGGKKGRFQGKAKQLTPANRAAAVAAIDAAIRAL
ncbi:alanyl-tRNA synthetase [Capsaspora owczarzaki ATCC 30864]|uniref:Alanyl-tRNA synthetase n=1 Tax=Capsaspora owczarzaki (strain ATCC 30864) TaxID=595528 RepID=A0A0D2WYT4_CAPO3|nr:alanyl-tRNA synthetase [Capsaspora owczarzaki ATCC 30864]KJE98223.1 alanyl-tRNA synthetase [Capsaspora owczarzaki ATCC 30864]|eukprot:XP_004342474.2 alanyl-tRNA synthetase [Capsaspora owczarzaki ATCC 30864]